MDRNSLTPATTQSHDGHERDGQSGDYEITPVNHRRGQHKANSRTSTPNGGKARHDVIECDGVTYTRDREAPAQKATYIPPGNHENEKYRIATFAKFPPDIPILTVALARVGFYYTGYKDRVKCFSCGMAVEKWMKGDNPLAAKWHRGECTMARNEDPRNVSCRSSDYVVVMANGLTSSRRTATEWLTNIQSPMHRLVVMNLNMKSEKDRRNTFATWPAVSPSLPALLATVGFFYLGNLDRAQCFSCGGVLRNWSSSDDVEAEHRKHFPHCRFLCGDVASGNVPMNPNERDLEETMQRRTKHSQLDADDQQTGHIDIEFIAGMGFGMEQIENKIKKKKMDGTGYVSTNELINDLLEEVTTNDRVPAAYAGIRRSFPSTDQGTKKTRTQ